MLRIKWIYLLLALSLPDAWAQQATTPAQPSQVDSKTVPAAQSQPPQPSDKNQVQACPERFEFHPELNGVYKVGGSVKPPRPLYTVSALIPDETRKMLKKKHLKGPPAVSLLSLVVDAQGIPKNVCVLRPAGIGMDDEAVKEVEQYRFQPATMDGGPVAVRIAVQVNFQTY
jgi:protein TonB